MLFFPLQEPKRFLALVILIPVGGYAQDLAVIGHPRRQFRLGPAAQRFHFRFR